MAFDSFIKIDGIEGESTDEQHKGWIEIQSYGSGHTQRVSRTASSAGGASAERADFLDFQFEKFLDKASPKLALHAPRVPISIRSPWNSAVPAGIR